MPDYCAVVVGAGPAGSSAAIQLAEAGKKVLLIDKSDFPRDKICGDGLTSDALKLLSELGVKTETLPTYKEMEGLIIHSPSGRINQYPLIKKDKKAKKHSTPLGAVVARRELDLALVNRAKSLGVETSFNTGFLGISEYRHDCLAIHTSAHSNLTTSFLVAADGMWSTVRKSLRTAEEQPKRYLGDWMACRQYCVNVSNRTQEGMHVWFEPDLLPGYFWSFPLADEDGIRGANIGFGVLRSRQKFKNAGRKLTELMNRPHIQAVIGENSAPVESVKAWPIPADLGKLPLTGERTLFAGDAAAVTDPMTGEGVAQALLTGTLAAAAVVENADAPAYAATHAYVRSVRRALAADWKLAKLMHGILKTRLGAQAAIRVSGMTPWVKRNFARWLLADYPRALPFTPSRWK